MNIKVNDHSIDVKVVNNKMKWSLLSVHGMNSSMNFTHDLDSLDNNFNHIKISMPIKGDISMDELNKIVSQIINKHIKTRHLVLLGHSLGGVQVINNLMNNKVKKVILVAPFNPSLYKVTNVLLAKSILNGSKIGNLIKNKVSDLFPKQSVLLDAALDEKGPYKQMFDKNFLNKDFIQDIDKMYRDNHKETLYIIGSRDRIVNSKDFSNYVKSLGQEVNLLETGHNPFKDDLAATHKLINDFIPKRKRLFNRKVFIGQ